MNLVEPKKTMRSRSKASFTKTLSSTLVTEDECQPYFSPKKKKSNNKKTLFAFEEYKPIDEDPSDTESIQDESNKEEKKRGFKRRLFVKEVETG